VTDLRDRAERPDLTAAEALAIENALGLAIVQIRSGAYRPCDTCHGAPPLGFACLTCNARRTR
jgi:hypothetical protein